MAALEGPQDCVEDVRRLYQGRRDVLCSGLNGINWRVEPAVELAEKAITAGTQVNVTAVSVGVFFVTPVK